LIDQGNRGSPEGHYDVSMSLDELCGLRIAEVCDADAMLFLWCSAINIFRYGRPLMEAWGFPVFNGHAVWDKGRMGVGFYFRPEHEDLLLGCTPKAQTHFDDNSIGPMIRQTRAAQHSKKPAVHPMVERAIGGPYLELFGRARVEGWTVLGNQVPPEGE
jgi:N6-adenosine-specific RNA methylase IME4